MVAGRINQSTSMLGVDIKLNRRTFIDYRRQLGTIKRQLVGAILARHPAAFWCNGDGDNIVLLSQVLHHCAG